NPTDAIRIARAAGWLCPPNTPPDPLAGTRPLHPRHAPPPPPLAPSSPTSSDPFPPGGCCTADRRPRRIAVTPADTASSAPQTDRQPTGHGYIRSPAVR